MFKCCGISKPDPLNPPHRGTLNVRTENPNFYLFSPYEGRDREGSSLFSTTFD